jgi:DNA-directed RNA polymerase subunit L
LNERYEDNFSTHLDLDLDLSLEAGSSGGPDRNRVYKLLNTTTENLQTTRSVSIVGCSQSIPSTQTPEFTMMLDQRVKARTTHLNEKFERLIDNYEELCRLVLEMRSQMDGTCAPHKWRHSPDYDEPPPLSASPLF